jgi:plastocyanin domain-containing protein
MMKPKRLMLALTAALAAGAWLSAQPARAAGDCGCCDQAAPRDREVKAREEKGVQRATVAVDGGYSPATVSVKAGQPVELTFLRKEESGCGDLVQFPTLGLKRALKTGEKTILTFTPKNAGTIAFTCGMNMYRGQVVVK